MGKTEKFSLSFTVNNFSEVKEDLLSQPVIAHDLKWSILIQPDIIEKNGQQKKKLGYFLRCDGPDGGGEDSYWSCQATAELRVMAVKQGTANLSKEISHLFNSKIIDWGFKHYHCMDWADIESTQRGLIEDNSVTFLAHVTAEEPQRCQRCEERTCERCEERACKVCMKDEVSILFDPCGHICTCTKCSSGLNECPICRGKIIKKIRAFF